MSKLERQRPFNFGRVFFPGKPNAIPTEIRFQPLGNHVGNVIKLVEYWQDDNFPDESSFDRVREAAKVHDRGKPQKFAIQVKTTPKGKFKQYIYSFRGHRFLADSKDAWAKALAIGHHDFSVQDICEDIYTLKKEPQYDGILAKNPLAYACELYILEMCDQIEAELACRVLGDDEQAESRTFMDYTITRNATAPEIFFIEPWIFKEDTIELTFEYWSMFMSAKEQNKLQKCLSENRDKDLGDRLDEIVKDWWKDNQGQPEKQPARKAIIKPHAWVEDLQYWDCKNTYQTLAGFLPNPMQDEMFEAIANKENPAFLLEAPTGVGKLEAVLFPSLARNYRLFLPLPARSLLEDHKERIEKYLKIFSKFFPNREVSLVVDTGSQMYRWVYCNGEDITSTLNINLRRHLYKGDVILTTIDKFLYRYFGFGDKQKSFTFPLRIHREKTLICFDEAHSYDDISFTNFQSLVRSLYEAGRSLVLMTATMPPEDRTRFDYLELIDYIDDSVRTEALDRFQQQTLSRRYLNQRKFDWISDLKRDSEDPENFQNEFSRIALKEWQAKANRRIIAVVETVKDAVAIYKKLKEELGSNQDDKGRFLFLYHGRISDEPKDSKFSRTNIYKSLKHRDETEKAYILVTTSAIEVGCDLNAEVLISQICPPENLIQRAGRCNRRGDIPDAKVIVVGDRIPEFANSLDEAGWQKYQETLQTLTEFDVKAIASCISRSQQVDDYRVVELFSMLHDYVYGADLTCKPAHEKGLVITRSWKPSATLIYDDGTYGEQISKMPQVSVPVDRLIQNQNNQYANTHALERYYNQETTHWSTRPLTSGSAYLKDIMIKISPNNEGAAMFDGKPDYSYNPELGFVDLPGVFIKLKTTGFDDKLLCQHDKSDRQKVAIITYTKAFETEILIQQPQEPNSDVVIL